VQDLGFEVPRITRILDDDDYPDHSKYGTGCTVRSGSRMTAGVDTIRYLFVYGTLLDLNLVRDITGKEFDSVDAELKDHVIRRSGEYPAITPKRGEIARGIALKEVDQDSLESIDEYEGLGEWRRKLVRIRLKDGRSVAAYVYELRSPPPTVLAKIGQLVGWENRVPGPVEQRELDLWRNKCRSSMTPVSVFFATNSALLVFLAQTILSQGFLLFQPCPEPWLVAVIMYAVIILLSWKTHGFGDLTGRREKTWLLAGILILIGVGIGSSLLPGMPFLTALRPIRGLTLLLLTTSELFLVFSLEFYDSALNPDTDVVDVVNLERGGSRFYFVALWLTVLSVLLLFWAAQQIVFLVLTLSWGAAIYFVNRFEDTYHVKQD
jgi:gamma-glutamylcyclotransferase (GGCT)/AIG2-like uncharacterized protein YtfP